MKTVFFLIDLIDAINFYESKIRNMIMLLRYNFYFTDNMSTDPESRIKPKWHSIKEIKINGKLFQLLGFKKNSKIFKKEQYVDPEILIYLDVPGDLKLWISYDINNDKVIISHNAQLYKEESVVGKIFHNSGIIEYFKYGNPLIIQYENFKTILPDLAGKLLIFSTKYKEVLSDIDSDLCLEKYKKLFE